MRCSSLLAMLLVSVAVAGCTASAPAPKPLPAKPVTATMSVTSPHRSQKLLTYTLSIPASKLEAGSDMTVTVTVTNSTDATESSSAYYRVTVTNSKGKVWADNHPPGYPGILGSVLIGPKQTYRHEVSFGVPPEGGLHRPDAGRVRAGQPQSLGRRIRVRGQHWRGAWRRRGDVGPLALGQVTKVGPYEVVLQVVNSKWKPTPPPYMSIRHGPGPPLNLPRLGRPARTAQLAAGVVVRNPQGSQEASLPLPAFDPGGRTFTLIDRAGRSWEASGGVSLQTTGWRPKLGDIGSGAGGWAQTVLRPGDYLYMSPIFFVPADAEGLMLIYRPLTKSPGNAVEFVVGRAFPETTIGDVVKEMKARARAGDLAYFTAHGVNEPTGRMIMRAVRSADMSDYVDHLAFGDDNAGLDYHDDGNFGVDLVHTDAGWSLRTVMLYR